MERVRRGSAAWQRRTSATFGVLARHRPAGVGLALVVECLALAALGRASTSTVAGLPAAVAASIAGSVAVVFGLLDGALVALAGAVVFGLAAGWGDSELATLVVWPALVCGAGLVGRRVERHRTLLRSVLRSQENERERVAVELHDDIAQTLASAVLSLGRAETEAAGEARAELAHARELVQQSIRDLREVAVDLRPRALDHFGLGAAVAHLAEGISAAGGLHVRIGPGWDARFPAEVERHLFRIVQDIVKAAVGHGPGVLWLGLETGGDAVTVVAREALTQPPGGAPEADLRFLAERVRLLGGRFTRTVVDGTTLTVAQVVLPAGEALEPRAFGRSG